MRKTIKFTFTEKIFRQINSLGKTLLSRNFCQKCFKISTLCCGTYLANSIWSISKVETLPSSSSSMFSNRSTLKKIWKNYNKSQKKITWNRFTKFSAVVKSPLKALQSTTVTQVSNLAMSLRVSGLRPRAFSALIKTSWKTKN